MLRSPDEKMALGVFARANGHHEGAWRLPGAPVGPDIVTSSVAATAANFGFDKHVAHDQRYRQAHEFMKIVRGLWDSYADDAFLRDKASGVFFDTGKLHYLNHKGDHLSVKGPLNIQRPVQGHPVLIQAGASEPGKALAAEVADVIFGSSGSLAGAQAFYADVKARAQKNGRDPLNIMASDYPGGFADFCRLVVPELRKRGLVRTGYRGTTLREHVGLPRPAHCAPAGSTPGTAMHARARAAMAAGSR